MLLQQHTSDPPRLDSCNTDNDNNIATSSLPSYINDLFIKVYGVPLVHSDGGERLSPWCKRWVTIIWHRGLHYSLPGDAVRQRYVDQLSEELNYFCNGTYPSERVLYSI